MPNNKDRIGRYSAYWGFSFKPVINYITDVLVDTTTRIRRPANPGPKRLQPVKKRSLTPEELASRDYHLKQAVLWLEALEHSRTPCADASAADFEMYEAGFPPYQDEGWKEVGFKEGRAAVRAIFINAVIRDLYLKLAEDFVEKYWTEDDDMGWEYMNLKLAAMCLDKAGFDPSDHYSWHEINVSDYDLRREDFVDVRKEWRGEEVYRPPVVTVDDFRKAMTRRPGN